VNLLAGKDEEPFRGFQDFIRALFEFVECAGGHRRGECVQAPPLRAGSDETPQRSRLLF